MHINNVTTSQTHLLYCKLLEAGFNAELCSMFQYSYNRDNNYLAVMVRDAAERLNELYGIAKEFDIRVVKLAEESNVCLEIRKGLEFAEIVADPVWSEYYNILRLVDQDQLTNKKGETGNN